MAITLSEAERAELVRRKGLPHRRSAEKARIILACAGGMSNAGVARLVGVQTGRQVARAFATERMAGLEDAGWIGRPKADLILDAAERRLGSSADIALAESFNATLKRETLQGRKSWTNAREARLDAFRWLHRYSTRRHHSRLGYLSPMRFSQRNDLRETL